jgi:SAM-dependent methyltransferase
MNDKATCGHCEATYAQHDGVTYLTDLATNPALNRFAENYKKIRAAEGYSGHESAFYCDLPQYPKTGPEAGIWHIRQRSYAKLMQHLACVHLPGAKILDLGSGNGWLSHQLALHSYASCAVDINDDWDDGLRGVRHYPLRWPALLSSFDSLPFPHASLDVAIFNGSFHYSESQSATLEEVKRVLRPNGQIIIMDSPIYSDPSSGLQMVADRARYHQENFDYQSEIDVTGFLTWQGLRELADQHALKLSVLTPWYGLKWALRPMLSRIRRTRQPARFALVILTRPQRDDGS